MTGQNVMRLLRAQNGTLKLPFALLPTALPGAAPTHLLPPNPSKKLLLLQQKQVVYGMGGTIAVPATGTVLAAVAVIVERAVAAHVVSFVSDASTLQPLLRVLLKQASKLHGSFFKLFLTTAVRYEAILLQSLPIVSPVPTNQQNESNTVSNFLPVYLLVIELLNPSLLL